MARSAVTSSSRKTCAVAKGWSGSFTEGIGSTAKALMACSGAGSVVDERSGSEPGLPGHREATDPGDQVP